MQPKEMKTNVTFDDESKRTSWLGFHLIRPVHLANSRQTINIQQKDAVMTGKVTCESTQQTMVSAETRGYDNIGRK